MCGALVCMNSFAMMRPCSVFTPAFVQIQRRRVRHAAQREQNFLGGNGNHFAFVLKRNGFQFSFPLRVHQLCAGENPDAFAPENLFDFRRRVGVEFLQNVFAALDQCDLDAEPREELRELARDGPPPRTISDFGSRFSASASSLVMKSDFVQLRQRRRRDGRAGGDDEIFCGDVSGSAASAARLSIGIWDTAGWTPALPAGQFHRVRIHKSRVGADEFELSRR